MIVFDNVVDSAVADSPRTWSSYSICLDIDKSSYSKHLPRNLSTVNFNVKYLENSFGDEYLFIATLFDFFVAARDLGNSIRHCGLGGQATVSGTSTMVILPWMKT